MPEHAGRVEDIGDGKTPGLHLRRPWRLDAEGFGKFRGLDAFPPCVEVGHQQLHHEIVGMLLHIEFLQNERRRAE